MKPLQTSLLAAAVVALGAGALIIEAGAQQPAPAASAPAAAVMTVPGMPGVPNAANLYSEVGAGKMSAAVKDHLERVYVPNLRANEVYVIDPATAKVVDRFKVGRSPQHVVPSWDLQTLWVANNAEG